MMSMKPINHLRRSIRYSPAMLAVLLLGSGMILVARAQPAPKEEWKAPARAARKANPVPADEKSITAGKALYQRECFSCHGAKGKGDGSAAKDLEVSPGNLSDPKMWQQTDGALFWKITEGKKPMPSFEKTFSEEERWHVVNYIRTLAPKPATAP